MRVLTVLIVQMAATAFGLMFFGLFWSMAGLNGELGLVWKTIGILAGSGIFLCGVIANRELYKPERA